MDRPSRVGARRRELGRSADRAGGEVPQAHEALIFRRGSSHTLPVHAWPHLAASRHRRRPNAAGRTAGARSDLDLRVEVSARTGHDEFRAVRTLSSCVPIRSDGSPSLLSATCRGSGKASQGVGMAERAGNAAARTRPTPWMPRHVWASDPLDAGTELRHPEVGPVEPHSPTIPTRMASPCHLHHLCSEGNFPDVSFGVRFQMRSPSDRVPHAAPVHHHRVRPPPTNPTTPVPGPPLRGAGRRPRDGRALRPCPDGPRPPRRPRQRPGGRPPRGPS